MSILFDTYNLIFLIRLLIRKIFGVIFALSLSEFLFFIYTFFILEKDINVYFLFILRIIQLIIVLILLIKMKKTKEWRLGA